MASTPWDRAARAYARQEHLEHRAVDRALAFAAPDPGDALLDVATGTGLVLRTLAARAVHPARAEGIDASREMLARVGPLPAGFSTRQADATALPHADASFDLATAAYLLHVLDPPDRRAVLDELRRVVRPGGHLVVVTMHAARTPGRALLAGLARLAPASLGGLRPLDPRAELHAAGWVLERAATVLGGYPSLVVRARRA